jgi:phosphoserine phosphatase
MQARTDWCITILLPRSAGATREQKTALVVDCADRVTNFLRELAAEGISQTEVLTLPEGTVARCVWIAFAIEATRLELVRSWLESQDFTFDVVLHRAVRSSDFKLIVFDLDSTLVTCEGIDELAAMTGVGDRVSAITASAMRGEIDFAQSFRQRIALLQGLEEDRVKEFVSRIRLTPGAELAIKSLQHRGCRTAIATGGFDLVASRLQRELGIDAFRANHLECKNGRVTGAIREPIVDAQSKADFLTELSGKYAISANEAIAIGDGANDIPMMQVAGFSVAYHAKPKVKEVASCALSNVGMDGLLYILQADYSSASESKR